MAGQDGTDPALLATPIPLDGDGAELVGMVVGGRYRLDATLGRGGMGLVFRATHIGLRKQAAVKILHPALAASPDVRNRFDREALAAGRIDHPNCVATYDVGQLPDGSLYLAMELLEGKSLADVLEAEGQLAPGRALHILGHLLRGLGSIHEAGLIHRDIKPENIFLIRHGDDVDFAKILDFGIAKPMTGELSDDGVRLTQAGMAFGTPIYMAPEQALGNPMDGRADLYAASVIGYEMLCGQPPFYSDDKLEVMSMHTARPVPPMRQRLIKRGRSVPSSLEKLVVRGLTKKPSDRYANAQVYLAAVEEALHTPDGGVTDVNFERPADSGAQPLVGDDGEVRLTGGSEFVHEAASIEDAIEEVLAVAPGVARSTTPVRGSAAKVATPGRGLPAGPADRNSGRLATKLGVEPPIVAPGEPRGRLGGVGIGIPYTGPSGEPIFGLTPEQRLAQVPRSRRWLLYAGIAGVAVVAGVVIAIATAPSGGGKLDPTTPAGAASEALDHGNPSRAIQLLDTHNPAIASDPDAQLLLGRAHADLHQSGEALAAYRRALVLAPGVEADPSLRANLRVMAADKDPEIVMDAFDLWVATTDGAAKAALIKAAVSQDPARRRAARPVIEHYKLGDQIDWITSYGYDLEQEPACEARKEAVAHLRALDNRKAIPALERAVVRRLRKPNACLVDDANAAIGYLKGLKPGAKP